jgi:hypothetical protein
LGENDEKNENVNGRPEHFQLVMRVGKSAKALHLCCHRVFVRLKAEKKKFVELMKDKSSKREKFNEI